MAAQRRQTSNTAGTTETQTNEFPPEPKNGAIMKFDERAKMLRSWLDKCLPRIEAASVMRADPNRLVQIAMTAYTRTPDIWECSPRSIVGCAIQTAALGLSLDPIMAEAHMVPFNNRHTGQKEAQIMPGYQGRLKLIRDSGLVQDTDAQCVYENDFFEHVGGLEPKLVHIPFGELRRQGKTEAENRGKPVAAYSIVFWKDGSKPSFKVIYQEDADRARASSRGKEGPWYTDPGAMWAKTAIHRHWKTLPKTPAQSIAERLEDMAALNIPQELGALASGDDATYEAAMTHASDEVAQIETSPQTPAPNITEELLSKIREKADALIAKNGDCEAFDDIVTKVAKATKQKSHSVQKFTEDGLVALLAALEVDANA